ncbi:hypothetical protein MUK70_10315 [Dyadobacter chenwenxiniae]|uniref:hypothetical protein n=1 Tax=Dyadobacter chenwenxiniae TaxID=2906456 RepID=UPI001F475620|nr:hypothetical protein [Dyadobacter chenwenxiniae]UON85379.1 hypothetical protein MUK70_10315 [Dyadobacter chenwenxiniae]
MIPAEIIKILGVFIRKSLHFNHLENIPIVVFTYSDRTQDIDDCYRQQANAYLVKPLDITGWRFYFENPLDFWSTAVKPAAPTKPVFQKWP